MKRKRFSVEQIVAVLKRSLGDPLLPACLIAALLVLSLLVLQVLPETKGQGLPG